MAQGPDRLREDVKREFISWVNKRGVAVGIPGLERHRTTAHTQQLCIHDDVAIAVLHEVFARDRPERLDVLLPSHVDPFHDHRAVELRRVGGQPHQHATLVWCRDALFQVRGGAVEEVLVLGVAVAVSRKREQAVIPRIPMHAPFDGALNRGVRHGRCQGRSSSISSDDGR